MWQNSSHQVGPSPPDSLPPSFGAAQHIINTTSPAKITKMKGRHVNTNKGFGCFCRKMAREKSVTNTSPRVTTKPCSDRKRRHGFLKLNRNRKKIDPSTMANLMDHGCII